MKRQAGQAMIELVVALVVMLVLFAGILQIGSMGVRHSKLMTSARRDAGGKAMQEASTFASPDYVGACTLGNDGIPFSRDDEKTQGNMALLQVGIAGYAEPDDLNQRRSGNLVSAIAESAFPQGLSGLVDGEATESVELLPVVRALIYQSETVELQGKVWMTWTKGVY